MRKSLRRRCATIAQSRLRFMHSGRSNQHAELLDRMSESDWAKGHILSARAASTAGWRFTPRMPPIMWADCRARASGRSRLRPTFLPVDAAQLHELNFHHRRRDSPVGVLRCRPCRGGKRPDRSRFRACWGLRRRMGPDRIQGRDAGPAGRHVSRHGSGVQEEREFFVADVLAAARRQPSAPWRSGQCEGRTGGRRLLWCT